MTIDQVFGGIQALLFLLFCYFLPTIVAGARAHVNTLAIFVLNLLLGWTLLFWLAALIWAFTANVKPKSQMKNFYRTINAITERR